MQPRPAFSAEALHHFICRSNREWQHQKESGHANCDEWPFKNVGGNRREMKEAIEGDVGHQVERPVEKREKSKHSSESDQPIKSSYSAQGGDGERDHQKK